MSAATSDVEPAWYTFPSSVSMALTSSEKAMEDYVKLVDRVRRD